MGVVESVTEYEAIRVRFEGEICYLQLYRPEANNTINECLIEECAHALESCGQAIKIVVLEGLPEVFCFGADLVGFSDDLENDRDFEPLDPEPLFDLWQRLACGPYITVAHVRGRANAGGVGFVAACDIALAEEKATFSLSELLFGLMPACVLPFLIRRMGFAKSHYMTLMTNSISAKRAQEWGLIDFCAENSPELLRMHLIRLRQIPKRAVSRYKDYISGLDDSLRHAKADAIAANKEAFSDVENLRMIERYVRSGKLGVK